jgi:hypothetical protein
MKASIVLRTALAAVLLAFSLGAQSDTNCPKCDCHFPISDPDCAKCCWYEKGTVTSVTSTAVTVAPILKPEAGSTKTFEIEKTTQINGKLKEGTDTTIYYHKARGQNIATRIDGLGFSHGSLVPANLPSPPDTCAENAELMGAKLPPIPTDSIRIFFGNSEAYSSQQRLIVWQIDDEEILTLQKTETGMYVSARIRDKDGQLVAQIVNNEFFINPHNSFQIKGPGTSSLVVNNDRGEQILDVEFLNPRVVKILGTFFGKSGAEIVIRDNEQVFIASGRGKIVTSHNCYAEARNGVIKMNGTGGASFN